MKNLEISVLLDYYGSLLPDKQRELTELYYNEDLSLSEIAENDGITRQGVRDSIKRAENTLVSIESKLGLALKMQDVAAHMDKLEGCIASLKQADSQSQINILCEEAKNIIEQVRDNLQIN